MRSPVRYVTYFVFSAFSLTCLIYYLVYTKYFAIYGYNVSFLFLIVSIMYTAYMFLYEIIKRDSRIGAENVELNVDNKNFVKDTLYKYLFSFSFVVFVYFIMAMFKTNFHIFDNYPTDGFIVADVYTNLILPVFLVCDVFISPRVRHKHVWRDVGIILLITLVHFAFKLFVFNSVYKDSSIFFPILANYMMIFLLAINGYALYDYIVHKKERHGRDYLINQSAQVSA